MWGLQSQARWVRVLVGALVLTALAFVLFLCLLVYGLGQTMGGGGNIDRWLPSLVGLGACCLTVAFFFQTGRRAAVAAAVVCWLGAAGITWWDVRQRALEAALLRIGVQEPNMDVYTPGADNPRLARLDAPATLKLPRQGLPRLDGATALYPLYAAFVQATWPALDAYDMADLVKVSKTPEAYKRLFAREADIIFVARPSKAQSEAAKAAGLYLHLTPIGREAFVFYVSSENPVTGLTQAQIRGIYSGQITRWSEVGGAEGSIRAFQRPVGSGSQSMLEKIMGDTPLMKAPVQNEVGGMGGVVQKTSDYINYPGAIGYSFRVFVNNILHAGGIRLLTVDGVAPTAEAIADGSYPFSAEFYAATIGPPKGEARLFIDWMRSAEGQTLVERTGYVGLKGP
jgi:phosphate transport system substrate-binding protein